MSNPEECYEISKQTLDLMDRFAGPVNNPKRNLPSVLQFPERLNCQPIQPSILKRAPLSNQSQVFIQRTELDENPNMPHYTMKLQYMDFNHFNFAENRSQTSWTFDNLTTNNDNDDTDDDDDDWTMISDRAKLLNSNAEKQNEKQIVKRSVDHFVQDDEEILAQLRNRFGFKFNPNAEYMLTKRNPLLSDAV